MPLGSTCIRLTILSRDGDFQITINKNSGETEIYFGYEYDRHKCRLTTKSGKTYIITIPVGEAVVEERMKPGKKGFEERWRDSVEISLVKCNFSKAFDSFLFG